MEYLVLVICLLLLLTAFCLMTFRYSQATAVMRIGGGQKEIASSLPDFIKYNGSYYLYEEKECRKMDVAEGLGDAEDFEASRLDSGTRVYRIRGVMDDSQLAVCSKEVYKVYELISKEEWNQLLG